MAALGSVGGMTLDNSFTFRGLTVAKPLDKLVAETAKNRFDGDFDKETDAALAAALGGRVSAGVGEATAAAPLARMTSGVVTQAIKDPKED